MLHTCTHIESHMVNDNNMFVYLPFGDIFNSNNKSSLHDKTDIISYNTGGHTQLKLDSKMDSIKWTILKQIIINTFDLLYVGVILFMRLIM